MADPVLIEKCCPEQLSEITLGPFTAGGCTGTAQLYHVPAASCFYQGPVTYTGCPGSIGCIGVALLNGEIDGGGVCITELRVSKNCEGPGAPVDTEWVGHQSGPGGPAGMFGGLAPEGDPSGLVWPAVMSINGDEFTGPYELP
jgi:hypothetical protein